MQAQHFVLTVSKVSIYWVSFTFGNWLQPVKNRSNKSYDQFWKLPSQGDLGSLGLLEWLRMTGIASAIRWIAAFNRFGGKIWVDSLERCWTVRFRRTLIHSQSTVRRPKCRDWSNGLFLKTSWPNVSFKCGCYCKSPGRNGTGIFGNPWAMNKILELPWFFLIETVPALG